MRWLEKEASIYDATSSNDHRERVWRAPSWQVRAVGPQRRALGWVSQWREMGAPLACDRLGCTSEDGGGGNRKRVLEPHRAFIAERTRQTAEVTVHRLKEVLASGRREMNVPVGRLRHQTRLFKLGPHPNFGIHVSLNTPVVTVSQVRWRQGL